MAVPVREASRPRASYPASAYSAPLPAASRKHAACAAVSTCVCPTARFTVAAGVHDALGSAAEAVGDDEPVSPQAARASEAVQSSAAILTLDGMVSLRGALESLSPR